jgi:hypothetical protein
LTRRRTGSGAGGSPLRSTVIPNLKQDGSWKLLARASFRLPERTRDNISLLTFSIVSV